MSIKVVVIIIADAGIAIPLTIGLAFYAKIVEKVIIWITDTICAIVAGVLLAGY